jgi:hypothetical protein
MQVGTKGKNVKKPKKVQEKKVQATPQLKLKK